MCASLADDRIVRTVPNCESFINYNLYVDLNNCPSVERGIKVHQHAAAAATATFGG